MSRAWFFTSKSWGNKRSSSMYILRYPWSDYFHVRKIVWRHGFDTVYNHLVLPYFTCRSLTTKEDWKSCIHASTDAFTSARLQYKKGWISPSAYPSVWIFITFSKTTYSLEMDLLNITFGLSISLEIYHLQQDYLFISNGPRDLYCQSTFSKYI